MDGWELSDTDLMAARDQVSTVEGSERFFRDRMLQGWPEGAKLIGDALDEIRVALSDFTTAETGRRRVESGHVSGFDPFVPEIMRGGTAPYRQWSRRVNRPAVQIVQQHGGAFEQTPDSLRWNGALALSMAQQLTDRGIPVEIVVTSPTRMNEDGLFCPNVIAKRTDEPVKPDLLASLLVWGAVERWYFIPLERAYRMPGQNERGLNKLYVVDLNSCVAGMSRFWPELETALIVPMVYSREDAIKAAKKFTAQLED
jgi:hypothetical protein